MEKSKIFLILSLNFIGGVFLRSFFEINLSILYFLVLLAIIIAAVSHYRVDGNAIILSENLDNNEAKTGNKNYASVFSGAVFMLVLGIWITGHEIEKTKNSDFNGKEFSEKVVIIKEPISKDNYQNIIARTTDGLKLLINASLYSDLEYGDEINLKCILKIPENKNGEFDYRMYLAKDGIFYLCQNADFKKTGENKGNRFYLGILRIKNQLAGNISKLIPEPEATLGNGIIFGGSSQLSKSMAEKFSQTGLSHIVAVSGYNVTIIAEYLMLIGIFFGLWRKQAFWFAVFGIFIFVLAVGFPSSAIRAGVMGSLLLWAMKNGRLANSFNAILFAAGIMLFLNPLLLRWDIGFQLSFLATFGIISLSPFWEQYLIRKNKIAGEIQETIFLTLSANIFVLPLILYNFHVLSIISVVANSLILPLIPLAMLLVIVTSIFRIVFPLISIPISWLAFLPLKYIIEVVNYLADLRWSNVKINNFNAGWMVSWYAILFLAIYFFKLKIKNTKIKMTMKN